MMMVSRSPCSSDATCTTPATQVGCTHDNRGESHHLSARFVSWTLRLRLYVDKWFIFLPSLSSSTFFCSVENRNRGRSDTNSALSVSFFSSEEKINTRTVLTGQLKFFRRWKRVAIIFILAHSETRWKDLQQTTEKDPQMKRIMLIDSRRSEHNHGLVRRGEISLSMRTPMRLKSLKMERVAEQSMMKESTRKWRNAASPNRYSLMRFVCPSICSCWLSCLPRANQIGHRTDHEWKIQWCVFFLFSARSCTRGTTWATRPSPSTWPALTDRPPFWLHLT